MTQYYEELIPVADIFLDPENPRHDIIKAQKDLIQAMLSTEKKAADKLVKLAEDIVEHGNNPSDLPIVTPHFSEKNKFIVLEGNRRITALKLLETPDQIPGSSSRSPKKKFLDLHKQFKKNPIRQIKCVVYPDKNHADHWIDLKHTGENEGAGTVNWGGTERSRRRARKQEPSPELTLKSFLCEHGDLDESEKDAFLKMPISTIKRIIGDPDMREALGLIIKGSEVETKVPISEAIRGLAEFFRPFAVGNKNVKDVYHKTDRTDYLKNTDPGSLPDTKNVEDKSWSLASPPEKPLAPKDQKQTKKRNPSPLLNRRNLIPSSCVLKIKDSRINKVSNELRRLDVETFENAVAVLFRVFLELSMDHFIESKKVTTADKDSSLSKKIQAVRDYLKSNKMISDDRLKPINRALSDKNSILSVDTFHAYIHNRFLNPKGQELKIAWDNLQPFVEKIWEEK